MSKKPLLGMVFGDINGIGPEIIAKLFTDVEVYKYARYVLFGPEGILREGMDTAGVELDYSLFTDLADLKPDEAQLSLFDPGIKAPATVQGEVRSDSGQYTKLVLEQVVSLANNNVIDGIVYGPLSKEALFKGGESFNDELHFFKDLTGCQNYCSEVNYLDGFWVSRVTSHIRLRDICLQVNEENILSSLRLIHHTINIIEDKEPVIGVSALNPHAGDGGLFGDEEVQIIMPALVKANAEGIKARGPYPADTIFKRVFGKKEFDAILSMYHDQGQIAIKLMKFDKGVTINAGLPEIFVTPAHGTAFDIAGKGLADYRPTKEAVRIASKLAAKKSELKTIWQRI